jgi:hypothetical protein
MLSPQDFARLLQDKLIEAGENRPLEFRADLFGFVPRGGDLSSIFPLDNYYRMYLAAPGDTERQRVVKQFTSDWLRHAKANAPVSPGVGGAPAGFAPHPLAGQGAPYIPHPLGTVPTAVRPASYPPPAKSATGCGMRLLVVVFGLVGIMFVCFCGAPLAMMGLAKNNLGKGGPGRGPPWGREWDFHQPPDAQVTEMVGGRGGGPRYYYDANRRPLIGLAFSTDEWFREQVIRDLVPLYDDRPPPPDRFHPLTPVRGKEGYVVGGLEVDSGEYVNAVRIIFVKRTDQGLDLSDTYESDWLGTPAPNREPQKLAGEGEEIIGVAARQGIILDSVGLLYRPAAKPPEPMVEKPMPEDPTLDPAASDDAPPVAPTTDTPAAPNLEP